MGQYRLGRRIARQRYYKEIGQSIVAPYYKESELAKIVLTGKQLIELGIYLVEIRDDNKSICFIRELRKVKNPQKIYVAIPKKLSAVFKNRQQVNVTLTKFDQNGFIKKVKDSLTRLYSLGRIELKDDNFSMPIGDKKLEFNITNYGYRENYDYTAAYLIFEGPFPMRQSFKIVYNGFEEPNFRIFDGNKYRTILSISYDIELLSIYIKYKHDKANESTRIIRLLNPIIDTIEVKQYIERYYQAKSKGMYGEMGAMGTAIAAKALNDMGYKVIWADIITGTTEGPDISLFDDDGNKVTVEVKSTSNINTLNFKLDKAIFDIETYYFDRTHPLRKFLWHTESETLEYEADYALAISIYLDRFKETVDMKIRIIKALVNGEGVKFERTPLKWRKEQIG